MSHIFWKCNFILQKVQKLILLINYYIFKSIFYYTIRKSFLMRFLLIFILFIIGCGSSTTQQLSQNGKLDLSQRNFAENKIISLDGEWNFCWKSFCTDDTLHNPSLIEVPTSWKGTHHDGETLTENGFATYHLNLKVPERNKVYAFKIIYINTAFSLIVNNKLVAENGTIGTTELESVPHQIPGVYSFFADTTNLDIKIYVSNFHFRKAGIIRSILFGYEDQIVRERNNQIASNLFMAGALFLFSLYHFLLFFLRKEEKSNLWFSFFCFIIAIRTLLIDERFVLNVYPEFDWFLTLKIIYSGIYLTLPTMISFVYSLYPRQTSKKLMLFTHYISLSCVLVTLTTKPEIYVNFFQYFLYLIVAFGIYIIFVLFQSSKDKEEGALFSLISFVIFYITVIIAILYEVDFPLLPSLLPYSLLAFLFSQSYIISFRFSMAFKEVELLNKTLEKRVAERTESYKKAKLIADSANEAKSRYLSFITHELRTPITAVNGYTELLLDDLEEDNETTYISDVKKIKTASSHLISLVNNILDIAKIEAGKMDVFVDKFDIKSLIIEVHTTIDPMFFQNKNKFSIQISPEVDYMIGDRLKLKQILINILSNATKFTNNGKITLHVSLENDTVQFTITDTGSGMTQDQVNQLFQSYTQFKEDRNIQGTGLGMAICKQFCELMNGQIIVESKPEAGTKVIVKIPQKYEII